MSKKYIEFESKGTLPSNAYANIYVIGKYEYEENEDLIIHQKHCSIVEAIPIEWLKSLQVKYLEVGCNMSVCVVNEIINLWEKENESN